MVLKTILFLTKGMFGPKVGLVNATPTGPVLRGLLWTYRMKNLTDRLGKRGRQGNN